MSLNIRGPESPDLRPKIMVFGVGGAGGNAVNNMIEQALEGAEFVVANTDAQALTNSRATRKIQLGAGVTQGLGAGAKPQVGQQSAEESLEELVEHLQGSHMLFITAGMGGGTGTGAAPVIARAAREMGILTVGVVTKPFQFEGAHRMRLAEGGIEELQQMVDTLIVIPNQNLFRLANERTTFAEAFKMADDVLYQGVKGVTDLMVRPGLINLDFADVRSVMDEMGKAMMGTGEAAGETRAIDAAEKAIANPLLDEVSLKGAKGVLINITGGYDLTLFELDEAANRIRSEVDPQANIIVGSTLDPELSDVMRVSVVATGIDVAAQSRALPEAPKAAEPAPRDEAELRAPEPPRAEAAPRPAAPQPRATAEPEPELEEEGLFDLDEASFAPAPAATQPAPPRDNPFVTLARESRAPARADLRPVEAPAPRRTEDRAEAAIRSVAEAKARQEGETPAQPAARQRFGLNNLIERMTHAARERESHAHGAHGAHTAAAPRREQQAAPAPQREEEEDYGMEIPAFLRRQAN